MVILVGKRPKRCRSPGSFWVSRKLPEQARQAKAKAFRLRDYELWAEELSKEAKSNRELREEQDLVAKAAKAPFTGVPGVLGVAEEQPQPKLKPTTKRKPHRTKIKIKGSAGRLLPLTPPPEALPLQPTAPYNVYDVD